jgi:hypothetical protein
LVHIALESCARIKDAGPLTLATFTGTTVLLKLGLDQEVVENEQYEQADPPSQPAEVE